MNGGRCWICNDRDENGSVGYSSAPMVLPGFTKPVWVCGNCILRANHEVGATRAEKA